MVGDKGCIVRTNCDEYSCQNRCVSIKMSDEDEFQSNRSSIRHRLYYPARLLPHPISGAETRKIWCMIENQQPPFFVQVEVTGEIEDLKTLQIDLLKLRLVTSVDVHADLPSDPIQINPIETLSERIRLPLS